MIYCNTTPSLTLLLSTLICLEKLTPLNKATPHEYSQIHTLNIPQQGSSLPCSRQCVCIGGVPSQRLRSGPVSSISMELQLRRRYQYWNRQRRDLDRQCW